MKRIFLILTLCGLTFMANAQEASVENLTYGVQTGFLGIWAHNEAKLSDEIALRTELGFDAGFFGGSFYSGTGFLLAPVITLEPRWYYNLENRTYDARDISGNSGNFLSLKTSFNPDWFVISNFDNVSAVNQISMVPTWAIRRNLGNFFNYEAGIGLGYRYIFAKNAGYVENVSEAAVNLQVRIGYRFQ